MRVAAAVLLCLAVAVLPAAGQEAALVTTAQKLTFRDPPNVGLRAYEMYASSLVGSAPVRPWLTLGSAVHLARATMSPQWGTDHTLSGLSSAEVFAAVRTGRLIVRGSFAPAVGRSELATDALIVASLASVEFLPFPVRGWGRGDDYALDATLRLESRHYEFDLLGSVRRRGSFTPLENDPMEYQLGNELRFGLRASGRPTALSWFEAGMLVSMNGTDRNEVQDVFEPGRRLRLHAAAVFPMLTSSVLVRGEIYRRGRGRALDLLDAPERVPSSVLGGGIDSDERTIASGTIETRSTAWRIPLLATFSARLGRGAGDNWLLSGGLGTEIEIGAPTPGVWHLVPSARLHRGLIRAGENFEEQYESKVAAWEIGVALRWKGR